MLNHHPRRRVTSTSKHQAVIAVLLYYWHIKHCQTHPRSKGLIVRVRLGCSVMAWIQTLPAALCPIQMLMQSSWQLSLWLYQQTLSKWHLKYITPVPYILSLSFRFKARRSINTPPLAAHHVICSSIFPPTHKLSAIIQTVTNYNLL